MPSKRTTNYNLSQWEADDKVLRADFNADNLAIDGAIQAVDVRVDGLAASKADASTVSELQSTLSTLQTTVGKKQDTSAALKLAVGGYTGNTDTSAISGSGTQTVLVGFKPRAVLVIPEAGNIYSNSGTGHVYGGLAVTDRPGIFQSHTTLEITSSGFTVHSWWDEKNSYSTVQLNEKGKRYNYIALG